MKKYKSAFYGICNSSSIFYTVLCFGMAISFCAEGQSDSLQSARELNEVKIRKVKLGKRQLSASPLQILSGEALERMNSLSVADAVRYFSGVQLKDYGGIGGLKTINVRSMGTNHTAVFYDGVQLGNAQNGQVDLGKFSLDNIEEIELYNGQKSTIFQPAKGFASGSSLYLNTKQPEFAAGEYHHLRATVKTGSFALFNPSLLWQTKVSEHVSASLSTEYKNSDGKYKFRYTNGVYDSTYVRKNADIQTMRIEAGLNGSLRDSSSWSAKFYYYKDEQGLPGAIVSNVSDFSQRLWNRNFFFQSAYKKESGRYNLMASFKYANDYARFLDPDFVTDEGLLNNIYKQQELYFSLVNRYQINGFWDVVLSGDYQRNTLDANLYRFGYPTRNTLLGAVATQFHFERLDVQANLLGTYVNDKVEQYFSAGNKNELSPTVMISWQPFNLKEFRLRSFYKSIFRMPTFNDLYYTAVGNTFLKPEYTKQFDLGATYLRAFEGQALRQISLQADVYYNKVKDKIIAVPGASLFRWSMQNLGKVEIKGLDVNLQSAWQIANAVNLSAGLTYTYQQALNMTSRELNYRHQIIYIPVHSGSLIAAADWKGFGINYSYIYVGERYDQNANIAENYVPTWYTHDIALHYRHTMNRHQYRISAEVNNLLNQYYNVITNFPMPGRSYRFTFSYTY